MLLTFDTAKSVSQFFTLLVIFAIVLAVTYFTTSYIANFQKGKTAGSNIELLEAARLNQRQYVQIVRIGDKYYALAISKDNVTVIGELTEDNLNLEAPQNTATKFADILKNFKNASSASDSQIPDSAKQELDISTEEEKRNIEENSEE